MSLPYSMNASAEITVFQNSVDVPMGSLTFAADITMIICTSNCDGRFPFVMFTVPEVVGSGVIKENQ